MHSLGVDRSERPARAVVVDEQGKVLARASADTGAAPARAATTGRAADSTGFAAYDGGEVLAVPGVEPIACFQPSAAAMTAEAWLGAARDRRHARRLPPEAMNDLRVEFSMPGTDAVAVGAARLAMAAAS